MSYDSALLVRLAAATYAGEAAARLRHTGRLPRVSDTGRPEDFGAFQWAEACGFADCKELRSMFSHAFCDTLDAARRAQALDDMFFARA